MPDIPDLIVITSSQKRCRVKFERRGQAVAANITWSGPERSAEDTAEVEAVVTQILTTHFSPNIAIHRVDVGPVSNTERREKVDRVINRFLKANEN